MFNLGIDCLKAHAPKPTTEVKPTPTPQAQGTLPKTGASEAILGLGVMGAVLFIVGGGATLVARRRTK